MFSQRKFSKVDWGLVNKYFNFTKPHVMLCWGILSVFKSCVKRILDKRSKIKFWDPQPWELGCCRSNFGSSALGAGDQTFLPWQGILAYQSPDQTFLLWQGILANRSLDQKFPASAGDLSLLELRTNFPALAGDISLPELKSNCPALAGDLSSPELQINLSCLGRGSPLTRA